MTKKKLLHYIARFFYSLLLFLVIRRNRNAWKDEHRTAMVSKAIPVSSQF